MITDPGQPVGAARGRTVLAALSPDARGILFLVAVCGGFFAAFLALGLTYYEDDIQNYYYPVLAHLLDSLRRGELPLWTPAMFAGFPYLADGSAGTLYPLMWTALAVPREAAIMWLIGLRTVLSAVFFFLFARAAGISVQGAALAALVYSFCGYSVGRWIHLSVAHSVLTLPLGLWAIERAHGATGGRRAALSLLLAGVATGLLWLGVHPQAALIATVVLGLYAAFRELAARGSRPFYRRVLRLAGGGIAVGLLAGGLAAGQLLPMFELSRFSVRAGGITYAFASSYALPPHNLLTFFWPYAFLAPNGLDWGLTNRWETALYVGVLPLALAAVAVTARRDRTVAFWAGLAVLSLWLALGRYVPLNLHYWVYQIPGFSIFRVPARFLLPTCLALAMLAGYGFDCLRRAEQAERLDRWLRRLQWALVALALLGGVFFLVTRLAAETVNVPLWWGYLRWPRVASWRVDELWPAVQQTWSPENPRLLVATAMILATAGLLAAWRRRPRWRRPELLLALAAVDLVLFAAPFWHTMPLSGLGHPAGQVGDAVAGLAGADRVFSLKWSPTFPNRLISQGVREVNSYGPLASQRYHEYLALARYGGNRLLDLAGVRWIVAPLASQLPHETQGVRYDRQIPLVAIGHNRPVAPPDLRLDATYLTAGVRIVGRLTRAAELAQGKVAGEIVLRAPDGKEVKLPILAGVHLADADAARADVKAKLAHQLPTVANTDPQYDLAGRPFDRLIYVSTLSVDGEPMPVTEVGLRALAPGTGLEIFGLGLVAPDGKILPSDRLTDSRQVERARDERARLLEVKAPLPRAFLASQVRVMSPDARLLYSMADHLSDPTAVVYLEEGLDPAQLAGERPVGEARIVAESNVELRVATQSSRPALLFLAEPYYPGWQATVDGQPTHIYRADYLFRAVVVPAGAHEVRMTFAPASVQIGLALSGFTLLFIAVAAGWLWRRRD